LTKKLQLYTFLPSGALAAETKANVYDRTGGDRQFFLQMSKKYIKNSEVNPIEMNRLRNDSIGSGFFDSTVEAEW